MTDKMRWRYWDTNPVDAAVDAGTVIEIGDLLWQNADRARPASLLTEDLRPRDEMKPLQQLFAKRFLGVAMQQSRHGHVAPIRVATTGVFEFDCPSSFFELGVLIGTLRWGNGLSNQKVAAVSKKKYAIARVAKREPSAVSSVLIDIRSTVMTGGISG